MAVRALVLFCLSVSAATGFVSDGVAENFLPGEREESGSRSSATARRFDASPSDPILQLEKWLRENPPKPKPTRQLPEQAQSQKEPRGNLTAREVAKRTFPSVVLLAFEQAGGKTISQGSGFFVYSDTVVTNYHVLEGATRGEAKIVGLDAAYSVAGVVAVSESLDLALLKVPGAKAPALMLGRDADVAVGDEVYAAGNPRGLEGTFSQGIVSAIRSTGKRRLFQITAPISPGSSGGPVLNSQGKVIGVAVATLRDSQNLNFAVAVGELHHLLSQAGPLRPFPSAQTPALAAKPPESRQLPEPKTISPVPRPPVEPDPVFPKALGGKDMGDMMLIPGGNSWTGLSRGQAERLMPLCQKLRNFESAGKWQYGEASEVDCRRILANEQPGRIVNVEGFLIDKRPVSVAQFKRFIDANGYARRELWSPAGWKWASDGIEKKIANFYVDSTYQFLNDSVMKRSPVTYARMLASADEPVPASWFEAQAYCSSVGKRLLSEAEWEKAARGDGRLFTSGDTPPSTLTTADAYTVGRGHELPQPYVSPYGLGQWPSLSGGWGEWVEDWWTDAQSGLKVLRGVVEDDRTTAFEKRLTKRRPRLPDKDTGVFRCANAARH